MGGRGASSGMSVFGNAYGSQYHALFTSGNIKFVEKNNKSSETLMETRTKGRIYVTVGGDNILGIVYMNKNNKRCKLINLDEHKKIKPHVHHGYEHIEYETSKKGASKLTVEERKMVDRVIKLWYEFKHK